MTHVEQAIKEAVKGGWDGEWDAVCGAVKHLVGGRNEVGNEHAFLDPAFWQALGKARGWGDAFHGLEYQKENGDREYLYWKGESGHQYRPHMYLWQINWHRFIDHLASGGTSETFFKEL